jgi:hypothetical protein
MEAVFPLSLLLAILPLNRDALAMLVETFTPTFERRGIMQREAFFSFFTVKFYFHLVLAFVHSAHFLNQFQRQIRNTWQIILKYWKTLALNELGHKFQPKATGATSPESPENFPHFVAEQVPIQQLHSPKSL